MHQILININFGKENFFEDFALVNFSYHISSHACWRIIILQYTFTYESQYCFFPITDSPWGKISDSEVLIFYLLKHIKMLDQKVSNNQIDHGWLDL